ncbi:hypothetical protein IJ541_04115 [bacterium]|nr:hypothetical protein [bacterium]
MSNYSKINPVLNTLICKPLRWFSESKVAKNAGAQVKANNRMYIDGLGVSSIVAKDGLGCYLYVTQSLNNKDIPDDKRKFVASLDLTNGVLMIALQLLMFFTVSHKVCQTKMFDKLFGKMFDRPIKKTYQAIVKNNPDYANINSIEFTKNFEKIRNNVKDAFGGLTSLAAATIVGKRMLVPFIATPLAGKVEKKMNEREARKNGTQLPVNEDKSNPSMQGSAKPEPVSSQPAQVVSPKFDTGSTNLLDKYRK